MESDRKITVHAASNASCNAAEYRSNNRIPTGDKSKSRISQQSIPASNSVNDRISERIKRKESMRVNLRVRAVRDAAALTKFEYEILAMCAPVDF